MTLHERSQLRTDSGSTVTAVASPHDSENSAQLDSGARWRLVMPTLLVIWLVGMFDKSNISIVIANPKFLSDLGLEHKQTLLGWLTTGLIIAYGVAAPVWGWLVTTIGARRTAIFSLSLWAIICFASGMAMTYGMLLTARVALGLAEASLYPITFALVSSWFPMKERGRATAFWWIGTMIGPMLTGVMITWLIVQFDWRMQFYALGLLGILLPVPMVWLLVRDTPDEHPHANAAEIALIRRGAIETNEDIPGRIFRERTAGWARNYRYWLVVASLVCNAFFFWGWSVWLPTYLKTVRHFSFSNAGYLTFVIYGCGTLSIIAIGFLSDRIFRRAPLAGLGWLLGGVFLLAATAIPNRAACVTLMILALSAQQTGISSAQMLFHSIVGTMDMAKSQGWASGLTQIFGSFSPVMIGYFLKASPGNFTAGFAVLSAVIFAAACCMATLAWEGL